MLKFCTGILITNVYKGVFKILDLGLFPKIKKTWFLQTHRNFFFNNSRSKKNLKNHDDPFVPIVK